MPLGVCEWSRGVVVVVMAAALAILTAACGTDAGTGPSAVESAPTATASSHEYTSPLPGVLVIPAGYELAEPSAISEKQHEGLLDALPSAFTTMKTYGVVSKEHRTGATLSRLALSPRYSLPADVTGLDEFLLTVGDVPCGGGKLTTEVVADVRIGRIRCGWLDSFAWVDASAQAVWVLSEHFDGHQNEWQSFVPAFVGAQG